MNAKIFIRISLFCGGVLAGNIGSAFAWECSAGHEHKDDEICTATGARPCPECEAVFHSKGEVCSETVFAFQRVDRKYVILPYRIPDHVIAELWEKYGYVNKNRESDTSENSLSVICFDDNHEMERLKCGIEKLEEKLLEGDTREDVKEDEKRDKKGESKGKNVKPKNFFEREEKRKKIKMARREAKMFKQKLEQREMEALDGLELNRKFFKAKKHKK